MRQLLTDFRGNPIYSFAQRRWNTSSSNDNHHYHSNSGHNSSRLHNARSSAFPALTRFTSPTPTLLCMIQNRAWDAVSERARTHPLEVLCIVDENGNTPLHLACRLDPPATVINAMQVTSRVANAHGATPLHLAASHRCNAAALKELIRVAKLQPESGDIDGDNEEYTDSPTADLSRMGRAPIHYACLSFRGLELEAFQMLLDATLESGFVRIEPSALLEEQQEGHSFEELDMNSIDTDDYFYQHHNTSGGSNLHTPSSGVHKGLKFSTSSLAGNSYSVAGSSTQNTININNIIINNDDNTTIINADPKTNTLLVNVMSLKDATGQTPLSLLFRRYRERVRCVIARVDRVQPDRASLAAAMAVHADLGELWEKARWLVARLEKLLQNDLRNTNTQNWRPPTDICMTFSVPRSTSNGGKCDVSCSGASAQEAKTAAAWAVEQHPPMFEDWEADWLMSSTGADEPLLSNESNIGHSPHSNADQALDNNTDAANERPFRIVHASVALTGYGCPPEMIRLALSMHPHQVREMDEDGNLPLHLAVQASSYLSPTLHAAAQNQRDDETTSMWSDAVSFFSSSTIAHTSNPFDKVIKLLLQHYPEAAHTPQGRTGQLPLVLALETRARSWDDGVRTLLQAYPPALHAAVQTTRVRLPPALYPHILATLAGSEQDKKNVDETVPMSSGTTLAKYKSQARTTLFELLRTKPEWLAAA